MGLYSCPVPPTSQMGHCSGPPHPVPFAPQQPQRAVSAAPPGSHPPLLPTPAARALGSSAPTPTSGSHAASRMTPSFPSWWSRPLALVQLILKDLGDFLGETGPPPALPCPGLPCSPTGVSFRAQRGWLARPKRRQGAPLLLALLPTAGQSWLGERGGCSGPPLSVRWGHNQLPPSRAGAGPGGAGRPLSPCCPTH